MEDEIPPVEVIDGKYYELSYREKGKNGEITAKVICPGMGAMPPGSYTTTLFCTEITREDFDKKQASYEKSIEDAHKMGGGFICQLIGKIFENIPISEAQELGKTINGKGQEMVKESVGETAATYLNHSLGLVVSPINGDVQGGLDNALGIIEQYFRDTHNQKFEAYVKRAREIAEKAFFIKDGIGHVKNIFEKGRKVIDKPLENFVKGVEDTLPWLDEEDAFLLRNLVGSSLSSFIVKQSLKNKRGKGPHILDNLEKVNETLQEIEENIEDLQTMVDGKSSFKEDLKRQNKFYKKVVEEVLNQSGSEDN